ncbi:hypothetical protein Tco_0201936 [Tanacetum coccineum]
MKKLPPREVKMKNTPWRNSEEEEELKKDGFCLMAHESNEVHSDSLCYSSSSLDDETLQIEYNKLCKISLEIINKNNHLKTKKELLDNEVFELKEKIKRFENSAHCLNEMLSNRSHLTECDTLNSEVKQVKFTSSAVNIVSDGVVPVDPLERDPASTT